ncbi:hypothetical protein [Gluconobacter thailandicus]|uniref:Uncharacterized protein n=1 Tax=Gluconobacter thailandicus TaxID=257438 RepID=A0AAP9JIU2_GLUTH|nr:hypothetical protein [Gluconobacter thailandicus]QEH97265.1 hypothetical protein FXF46_14170 [Gluconobacter thailandicus]
MTSGNPADIVSSTEVAAQFGGKVDSEGGQVGPTTSLFASTGNNLPVDTVLLDGHALRRAGCKLDGKTDDGPAINALITSVASAAPIGLPAPSVALQIPAGVVVYIGTALSTGTVSLSISGGGKEDTILLMKSGGSGVIQHGTTAVPAVGTLQIRDVSIIDSDITGSGAPAISAVFSSSLSLFGCMSWSNVVFRYFTQAGNFTNCPRDIVWFNVVANGPDNTMQDVAGFRFNGTAANTFGNFTSVFLACRVDNYLFGWDFHSMVPWEGQRFYGCTAYNGWGMVRAWLNPATLGGTNYQAPIWIFDGCDHQGYGFGLDLYGCRMVRVRSCYFVPNNLPSGISIPAAPDGTARNYRSMLSFRQCGDVVLDGANIESGNNLDSTSTLVYVHSDVSYFRSHRMAVLVPETIAAGFEYAAGNANNVCGAFDSYWGLWGGGVGRCVLDHSGNQMNLEAVHYPNSGIYYGEITPTGRYKILQTDQNITLDSNNRAAVTFPTRAGTTLPVFIGGAPHLDWGVLGKDTSAGSAYLYDITSTGFVIQFEKSSSATMGIEYTAEGF